MPRPQPRRRRAELPGSGSMAPSPAPAAGARSVGCFRAWLAAGGCRSAASAPQRPQAAWLPAAPRPSPFLLLPLVPKANERGRGRPARPQVRPCCARVLRCPLCRPGACCAPIARVALPHACTDAVVSLSRPSRRPGCPLPREQPVGVFPSLGGTVECRSLRWIIPDRTLLVSAAPPLLLPPPAACRCFEACCSRPTAALPFPRPQPQPWRRTCASAPSWTGSCGPPRRAAPSLTRKCGGCGPRCATRARPRCWTTCGCRR